jgi:hypothetical protein
LSTTNPTWLDPGLNPGRRGGKPATNRLSWRGLLIDIVGSGVQLDPLGTAATNRPIVPAPGDYDDREFGGMIDRGTEILRENLPQCRFVHKKTHMLPGREPGPPLYGLKLIVSEQIVHLANHWIRQHVIIWRRTVLIALTLMSITAATWNPSHYLREMGVRISLYIHPTPSKIFQ